MMKYFEYKGVKYGPGTIVKFEIAWGGTVVTTFLENGYFEAFRAQARFLQDNIAEIIKPVYYEEIKEQPKPKPCSIWTRTRSGSWQSYNDVCIGLIWYIIIMIVGAIFNDRWLIWIGATICFFVWKSHK